MLISWFLVISSIVSLAVSVNYKVVEFQKNGEVTDPSYARYIGPAIPTLRVFTTCLKINLLHVRGNSLGILSYAVPTNADELNLCMLDCFLHNTGRQRWKTGWNYLHIKLTLGNVHLRIKRRTKFTLAYPINRIYRNIIFCLLPVERKKLPQNLHFPGLLSDLDLESLRLHFECCHSSTMFRSNVTLKEPPMMVWLSFCVLVDLQKGVYNLQFKQDFEEGILVAPFGNNSVESNGILIIGQEQDTYGGGFSVLQSFQGSVADFFLAEKALSVTEMKEIISCKSEPIDSAISFQNLDNWEIAGETTVTEISSHKVCEADNSYLITFPEVRTMDESINLCRMLKSYLAAPISAEENILTLNSTTPFIEQCSTGFGVYLWLGFLSVINSNMNQTITTFKDGSISSFHNVTYSSVHGYVDGSQCVYFHSHNLGSWVTYPCIYKACVACNFTKPTALRLRGLCGDSLIDTKYYISGYENGKPKLEGLMHSKIYFEGGTWRISDTIYGNISAVSVMTDMFSYPFGLRQWYIEGDLCPLKNTTLLLTSCSPLQYTCNDGTCIRKMQRCDLTVNCPDQSDETLCSTVVAPSDYIQEVPPARVGKEPASISLHVGILSMQPVDTLNLKISLVVLLTLKWRDPRLDMESLNYAENMNVIIDYTTIWQPSLVFEDETGSEADMTFHWQTFVAVMESGPLKDDITRLKEDEVYPGRNNSLKQQKSYSLRFSCDMNLVAYPFDTQLCSFIIRLKDIPKEFVQFLMSDPGVVYSGAVNLKEYKVQQAQILLNNVGNFSGYKITLVLANLSGFYIFTTYIPTALMVVICYSTFLFAIEDFNDRIMVSITALLVLATLFAQITQSTPKTAYLKLLDVWFVSCIFINFAICILLVLINYLYEKEKSSYNVPGKMFMKTGIVKIPEKFSSRNLNRIFIVFVPVIVIVLTIVYLIGSLAYVM